jgi:hypothetical protein
MHSLQNKKNKGQFFIEKDLKTEEKRENFRGLKDPMAREPYGLPSPNGNTTF